MAHFTGLTIEVAKHLRPDTLGRVMTELLEDKQRYSLTLKDGAVVDVSKPAPFPNLNPDRVLRSVEGGIRGADYHRVVLINNTARVEVVGERQQPVVVGDMVRAGALVAFSPQGTTVPLVQSYAMRLACTNGAITTDVLRNYEYGGGGDGDGVWQWFREVSREAYQAIAQIIARWREMTEQGISPEDRAMALEAMLKAAKITGEGADVIRAEALAHPPRNNYEMMNLLTYASSHLLESPQQVVRAQITAARYADERTHAKVCPLCHRQR